MYGVVSGGDGFVGLQLCLPIRPSSWCRGLSVVLAGLRPQAVGRIRWLRGASPLISFIKPQGPLPAVAGAGVWIYGDAGDTWSSGL